jgi:hypothetical protein
MVTGNFSAACWSPECKNKEWTVDKVRPPLVFAFRWAQDRRMEIRARILPERQRVGLRSVNEPLLRL